jgi:hypothetical protein
MIEQLLDRFSFGDSAPAVRKVGFRVRNLVSVHGEKGQIRPQKSQSLITCNQLLHIDAAHPLHLVVLIFC